MILKEIRIKNFRSYYGENIFKLSEGLTLIIGDNGDGKTTFFEALEWLFNTSGSDSNLDRNISGKRAAELDEGQQDEVAVSILFEHDEEERELIKRFYFERTENGNILARSLTFQGYYTLGSERQQTDGKRMLDTIFDASLRQYCLFKGESELNVFDNDSALNTLVDTFSGIHDYDDYVSLLQEMKDKAAKVVISEQKKDKKNKDLVTQCEINLKNLDRKIRDIKYDIKAKETDAASSAEELRKLEEHQELGESYKRISDRIKAKMQDVAKLKGMVEVDYNARLLCDHWILRPYPQIFEEYKQKVQKLHKERRIMEKEEERRLAKEEATAEIVNQIKDNVNDFVKLPWYLPDDKTMQEMIDEQVCKVCGRPALKGTEPYNFMVKKLQDYLDHVRKTADDLPKQKAAKPLFAHQFIEELRDRSIQFSGDAQKDVAHLEKEITDYLDHITRRKFDLEKAKQDLNEAELDKVALLAQADGLPESKLEAMTGDYRGFFELNKRAETSLVELRIQLAQLIAEEDEEKKKLTSIEPANSEAKIFQRISNVLECIFKAFSEAKEDNLVRFIQMLEEKSNNYLARLNTLDFHGRVHIIRKLNNSTARIALISSDGTEVYNPSTSQKTTMYMSVLFAISELTTLSRENDYPLIFDAPTSSFGDAKATDFYNIINGIDKQCIIVTKDLLTLNARGNYEIDNQRIANLNCWVYRIRKADGFVRDDLSTIQTITTKIK